MKLVDKDVERSFFVVKGLAHLKPEHWLMAVPSACLLLVFVVLLASCMSLKPPSNTADLCKIFDEKRSWYRHALRAEKKWQVPLPVMMAVIYRESSFVHNARPARSKILWVIPWKRPSTAYGYSQALDETWSDYVKQTGSRNASRTSFRDSVNFVGWYLDSAAHQAKLKRWDAKNLYISYYAGISAYMSGSWREYPRLEHVANEVEQVTSNYENQLRECKKGPGSNYY